jgi:hypothetical protein
MAAPQVFSAFSGATRYHVSRASYLFAGPGSPASRRYNLLDVEGLPSQGPDVGSPFSVYAQINLGFPVVSTGATTAGVGYVISAHAAGTANVNIPLGATNLQTLTKFPTPVVVLDVPRNLQYVSSTTDTTQSVTVKGYDQYNQAMTETVALSGATPVYGKKAFLYVASVQVNILMAGNLSVGLGTSLGLPVAVDFGGFVGETAVAWTSGPILPRTGQTQIAEASLGTFTGADRTIPATATTGDVYGTYLPDTTLATLTTQILLTVFPAMGKNGTVNSSYGVPQF